MLTTFILAFAFFGALRLVRYAIVDTKHTHHAPVELPPPTPRVNVAVADAKEGELVKLVGRVKLSGEPILSPITARSCVACLVRAQVWHSRKIPQLIDDLRDARLAPFVLEVDGGEVIVDSAIAIEMRTARVTPRSSEAAHALLAGHKLERFLESTDFEEVLIQVGDRIAVTGVLSRMQESTGYRDVPAERFKLVPHARVPVTLASA